MSALARLVESRRVIACVGAGGVGKTTTAAALALGAARRGRRTLVLTIDPARRLADALGLPGIGHEPSAVAGPIAERLGIAAPGALSAAMLDSKRTFDALVHRFAPDRASAARILANPIYQHLSDALAGSAEYGAMEKVYEVASSGAFELVVLDTPPASHALDFLDAPQRLTGFLESALVQRLLHPAASASRFGLRWFQRGAHRAFQLMERVSGLAFLEDISEFVLAFEGMAQGFRERAEEVERLLYGPACAFVVVCDRTPQTVSGAERLSERLAERGARVAGVVVNRARVWPEGLGSPVEVAAGAADALAVALARGAGDAFPAHEAATAALRALSGYAGAVAQDEAATGPLLARALAEGRFARRVAELPRDVHDLEGLTAIERQLFCRRRDLRRAAPAQANPRPCR